MIAKNAVRPLEPTAAAFSASRAGRARRLWLATRPAFLPASVLPVIVGTAWGWQVAGNLNWISLCLALLATALVHAASNVLNDVGDEIVGTDGSNDERIFPYTGGSRFIQNGVMSVQEMKRWGIWLLVLAAIPGALLVWLHGWMVLAFGALGIALGVLYSVPRIQLAAHGIGEAAVGVAFGLLPVVGAAWLQSGIIDGASFAVSIPVALWVAAILLMNEVPDVRADGAAGKRTLVVRWGIDATRHIYLALQLAAVITVLISGIAGLFPWWAALPQVLLLPKVFAAARAICDVREDRARLTGAIETTLAVHTFGSLLLTGAILVAKFV